MLHPWRGTGRLLGPSVWDSYEWGASSFWALLAAMLAVGAVVSVLRIRCSGQLLTKAPVLELRHLPPVATACDRLAPQPARSLLRNAFAGLSVQGLLAVDSRGWRR